MSKGLFEKFIQVFGSLEAKLLNLYSLKAEVSPQSRAQYIAFYKSLESAYSVSKILSGDEFEFLKRCANFRNVLSHGHNPRLNDEFFAAPSQEVLDRISQIEERFSRLQAPWDIAVKTEDIYSVDLNTPLKQVIQKMRNNSFSHVPVLEHGRVIGIFGEDVLANKFMIENFLSITELTIMKDIEDYIGLSSSRRSEVFKFVNKDETLENLERIFTDQINVKSRLSLVLITEDGKADQELLGLLTVWDMPRAYSSL